MNVFDKAQLLLALKMFYTHNHTYYSNLRLKDAINSPEELLDYVLSIGGNGCVITDHEILSAHVRAYRYMKDKPEFEDFVLGYGNEIYLVDEDEMRANIEAKEKQRFYHFILIAKDEIGYEALKILSSQAWENSFTYRGMERVPTFKHFLREVMMKYKGHVMASTACVGGELPVNLVEYAKTGNVEYAQKALNFVNEMNLIFGEDDFYFELQPAASETQAIANEMIVKMKQAQHFKNKLIIATDAHYLTRKKAFPHEIYLKSANGEREVAEFYATTYVMAKEELETYFDTDMMIECLTNLQEIRSKIKPIHFERTITVPIAKIPEYTPNELLKPFYQSYEYIGKYATSPEPIDRYYLHLIANGLQQHNEQLNEVNLSRINTELMELWKVSEILGQPMSSYFVLTKDLINIMWKVSLVGVSRGSASCYYLNYLLDIVQINPIKYNLPHWRFLTHERASLPDIDIDTESSKRLEIVEAVKAVYGEENVLNMGTFTTEAARKAMNTACRGLDIDTDIARNLANLIPTAKGTTTISLAQAFFGDEKKGIEPCNELIREVDKYEGLRETVLNFEGLVSGRGQHASGIIIYPNGYIKQNAMMKTKSGLKVTQFDATDSEYMGGLKYDFLSINALDRIRSAMDLLLKYGKIKWQGTLKATYDKYLHPDVLELQDQKMFDMLFDGEILNAFQFETAIGRQTLLKVNARNFDELCAANSLMRLSVPNGEQPLDKYIRYKNNINEWYKDMVAYGLNKEEIEIMKRHLSSRYGVCDTQEFLMQLSMDKNISNFDLGEANKLRKAVAKKNEKKIEAEHEKFFESGLEAGTREVFLNYVWEEQFKSTFGYAFSLPHIDGYTLILMIEMNICYKYGSIFWKTACLSVNAGLLGDSIDSNVDYGAIAKAIGNMRGLIASPNINKSDLGFTPYEEKNKILFGLKSIVGLGKDAAERIVNNQPYASFNDFLQRMYATGELSDKKIITLIKAGCFDDFLNDRYKVMTTFVQIAVPRKDKLTTTCINTIRHATPKQYSDNLKVYDLKAKLFGRSKLPMTKEIEKEFYELMNTEKIEFEYNDNGLLNVNEKSFKKEYDKAIAPLKEWLKTPEAISAYNNVKLNEYWKKNCLGSIEAWEMETTLFYSDKHEIENVPLDKYFNIDNFNELPEEPIVTSTYTTRTGRIGKNYMQETIAGTVVEKDKTRSIIFLSTKNGVVNVKISKGKFAHYDKKVVEVNGKEKNVLDSSWFERGTKLVIFGVKRGENFYPQAPRGKHSIVKIAAYNKEKAWLQTEKITE